MANEFVVVEQKFIVQNSQKDAVNIWLEPWGDVVTLASGEKLVISGIGPSGNGLQLELRDNEYAVYAWSGSVLSIEEPSGKVLWESPTASP